MQIQINTDNRIEGNEALAAQVRSTVETVLSRISDQVTRVEVHLSDESGDSSTMRCMIEARLKGRQPIVVTHEAAALDNAVKGGADKLARLIESTLARQQGEASHQTHPGPVGS